jgi:hypothetical protein
MKRIALALAILALPILALVASSACYPQSSPSPSKLGGNATWGPQGPTGLSGDAASSIPLTGTFGQQKTLTVEIYNTDGAAWTGTINFQGSNDGTNWNAVPCVNLGGTVGAIGAVASSTTANGLWQCNVSGLGYFQAQGVTISTSANVTFNLADSNFPISFTLVDAATGAVIRTSY